MRICPDGAQGKTATRGATFSEEVDQGLGLGGEGYSEFGAIDAEDLLLPMYPIEGLVEVMELIPREDNPCPLFTAEVRIA